MALVNLYNFVSVFRSGVCVLRTSELKDLSFFKQRSPTTSRVSMISGKLEANNSNTIRWSPLPPLMLRVVQKISSG